MDYFLAKPKPKPLTQDELLALFNKSEAKAQKAKANSKNQQTKSCGCCSADNTKKTTPSG